MNLFTSVAMVPLREKLRFTVVTLTVAKTWILDFIFIFPYFTLISTTGACVSSSYNLCLNVKNSFSMNHFLMVASYD